MKKSSSQTKKVTKKASSTAAKKTPQTKATKPKKLPATKKVAAKKTTTKKAVPLICAPTDKQFWTNDGQILADLITLADSFAAMDALLFNYHANEVKNDFADWVEHVLEDEACAKLLRKANTPKKAHGVVMRRLRHYQI